MAIKLPPLPFSLDALQPYISEETMKFHYGKHHKNYVDTLNKLIDGTEYDKMELEAIILQSVGLAEDTGIFNNAAQAWNHTFFWNCLRPASSEKPNGECLKTLERDFHSFDEFKNKFTDAGKHLFGSGWVWLVRNPDMTLSIKSEKNAGNPMTAGCHPVLACDVWEHAYYLDYKNERPKFLENFWQIVNWDFVSQSLEASEREPTYLQLYKKSNMARENPASLH